MKNGRDTALLSADEIEIVELLGNAATIFARIARAEGGVTGPDDTREFVAHIHDCQNAVLAQAAARAYPRAYRRIGSVVG